MINKLLTQFSIFVPTFSKPLFIISAPRSGSSYFYEVIRRMEGVLSFDRENSPMWFRFFPYSRLSIPSDYISGYECDEEMAKKNKKLYSCEGDF